MSIEDEYLVDAMGINSTSNEFELIISDHLPWIDAKSHLQILEKKIQSYVNFIASDQINEGINGVEGLIKRIVLIYKFPPHEEIKNVLDQVGVDLTARGIMFSHGYMPQFN